MSNARMCDRCGKIVPEYECGKLKPLVKVVHDRWNELCDSCASITGTDPAMIKESNAQKLAAAKKIIADEERRATVLSESDKVLMKKVSDKVVEDKESIAGKIGS